jgi:acetyl-CoA carboxylase carboxyltransferase component
VEELTRLMRCLAMRQGPSALVTDRELDTFIPDSPNTPYDMHTVITHVLDDGEFLEVQALFGPNILTGFGRVEGSPVGVAANQPTQFAGTLDIDASEKAARFVFTEQTAQIGEQRVAQGVETVWPVQRDLGEPVMARAQEVGLLHGRAHP